MPVKVPALVSTALIVVATIFPVMSLCAILLRYKARRTAAQNFQSDDYWAILAWVSLETIQQSKFY